MRFDRTRVRLPDRIVGGGALGLFVFLFFFHWYGGSVEGLLPGSRITGATIDATGWEAFTSSRWVWLVTIVVALGSVLAAAAAYKLDGPVQIGATVFGMGLLSSVLIVYRIVYHPGESASGHGLHIGYGIKFGIWLGLLAALAITLGGYLQMLAEGGKELPSQRSAREEGPEPEEPGSAFSGLTVRQAEPAPPTPRSNRAN